MNSVRIYTAFKSPLNLVKCIETHPNLQKIIIRFEQKARLGIYIF